MAISLLRPPMGGWHVLPMPSSEYLSMPSSLVLWDQSLVTRWVEINSWNTSPQSCLVCSIKCSWNTSILTQIQILMHYWHTFVFSYLFFMQNIHLNCHYICSLNSTRGNCGKVWGRRRTLRRSRGWWWSWWRPSSSSSSSPRCWCWYQPQSSLLWRMTGLESGTISTVSTTPSSLSVQSALVTWFQVQSSLISYLFYVL